MGMRLPSILLVVLLGAALLTGGAAARTPPVPQNTTPPSIGGTAREGNTLTARNGTWANSPTSFAYQWQRCSADGTNCSDISGATNQSYTLAAADVDHAVRVAVTASNSDGQAPATSSTTAQVSSRSAPVSSAKPTISGTPRVGEELTASNGTWTGGGSSPSYQWQHCTASAVCTDVNGATARTYGVRTADVGSSLRVTVTAHNASGSTASATSDTTSLVSAISTPIPTPTKGNQAPKLTFLSLKRV